MLVVNIRAFLEKSWKKTVIAYLDMEKLSKMIKLCELGRAIPPSRITGGC